MNELNFRIALLKNGLTQNRLASLLGILPQALSAMVRGYRVPPEQIKIQICSILKAKEKELFEMGERKSA